MATLQEIEEKVNHLLGNLNIEVWFGEDASDDLKGYRKEINTILGLIVAMAQKGPLIKPEGYGEPLLGPLFGFTKIKPKAMSLRIVYRPIKVEGKIRMEIIAIGPKNREEVYHLAAARVQDFKIEMEKRAPSHFNPLP